MQPGRNDPCPCGSGRKYKHCHQHADEGAARENAGRTPAASFASAQARRKVREIAGDAAAWEADIIPLRIGFENETEQRPVAALVTADGLVLHHDVRAFLGGEAEDVARLIEKSVAQAARETGAYPPCLRVRHDDVASVLRAGMEARGVVVEVSNRLPEFEEAARALMEKVAGGRDWPPACMADTWGAWALPSSLIADVFRAAAAFWRAAPWRIVENLQAPLVRLASGRPWLAAALGNAGQEFGLVLYSDELDIFRAGSTDGNSYPFAAVHGRILSLSFTPISQAPPAMQREIRRRGWQIASPQACPMLFTINTPGGGLSQSDGRDLITLLEAVPRFVSAHRALFLGEQRTHVPAEPVEWRDAATGSVFSYDGELMATRAAEFNEENDGLRKQIREAIADVASELGHDASDDEWFAALNARTAEISEAYNQRSQSELGDLAPAQVSSLLAADWSNPKGAVRLRRDLVLGDLGSSALLSNTRLLLSRAAEQDGLLATQHGNLRVTVVRELLPGLRLDFDYRDIGVRRITEPDIWPLHVMRVVAGLAGLLQRRKGRFHITRKGRTLLAESRAGELFALLFETYFRKFNLAYGSRIGEQWPELQHQIAFTLFRLSVLPPEWDEAAGLFASDVVLPFALERAPDSDYADLPAIILETQVLDVLVRFGLAERKQEPRSDRRTAYLYRRTPLYQEFLSFALDCP